MLKVKGEELPLPLRAERSLPARGQAPLRAQAEKFVSNKINTLKEGDKKFRAKMDFYIRKFYPLGETNVPSFAKLERKFYQVPVFQIITFLLVLTGLILLIKPWGNHKRIDSFLLSNTGDLLIRTKPSKSLVEVFYDNKLKALKNAPADFLNLEKGVYKIVIKMDGFQKKELSLKISPEKQTLKTIYLVPLTRIRIIADINHGFDKNARVSLDGEVLLYYDEKPLKVNQIKDGWDKTVSAGQHAVEIGGVKKKFNAGEEQKEIRIRLKDGKILIRG